MRNGPWSKLELVKCLAVYASLDLDKRGNPPTPLMEELARTMSNRSLDSVKMRMSNYIARDPKMKALGKKGMFGGGTHVDDLWKEYSQPDGTLNLEKLLLDLALLAES